MPGAVRSPILPLVLLAAITLAGGVIRGSHLGHSLWLDELHTAWTVGGSLSDVLPRSHQGNTSGLYFALCWAVVQATGLNEVGIRLLSVISGTLLIPASAWLVWRWTRQSWPALLTAALVAGDSFCVYFARDARPYALVQLVGVVQLTLFTENVVAQNLQKRVGLVLATVVLFYLHYTAILLVLAEVVALLWSKTRRHEFARQEYPEAMPYRARDFVLDVVLAGVVCLPELPHLLAVADRRENWSQFVQRQPIQAVFMLFPVGAYVVLPFVIATVVAALRRSSPTPDKSTEPKSFPAATLLVSWMFVPPLAAWTSTWLDAARFFFRRYLVVSAVAPAVAAGWLCARFSSRCARIAFTLAALLAGQLDAGVLRTWYATGKLQTSAMEDWRQAVELVRSGDPAGTQPVLVRSGLIESEGLDASTDSQLRNYCLLPVNNIYDLSETHALIPLRNRLSAAEIQTVAKELQQAGGGWLLFRGSQHAAEQLAARIVTSVRSSGKDCTIAESQTLPGVVVCRFEVE